MTIKNLVVKRSVSGFVSTLLSSNNNIVTDNVITRTFGFEIGIYLTGSHNNTFKNNNSFLNSFFAIYLEESFNNIITENISDSHLAGILS